jgi:hypothetical protein
MKTGDTAMDLRFSLLEGSADTVSNRKLGQAMLEGLTHSIRPIPASSKNTIDQEELIR